MTNIIEQLEIGKKIQEEQGIDSNSLRTKLCSKEEQDSKQNNTQDDKPQDPFEQAEQIINELKEKPKEKEETDKYPGFDFNDSYVKGQTIFYVRVHEAIGVKDVLELKLRTIYPKMLVGSLDKGACYCIGPESSDMVFISRKDAVDAYNNINIKAYKDVNFKDELGDIILKDTEE